MSEGTETGLVKLHAHDAAIAAVLPAMEYTEQTPGKQIDKARKEAKNQKQQTKNQLTVEDGEENTLPVLPNRLLVTETLPLAVVRWPKADQSSTMRTPR